MDRVWLRIAPHSLAFSMRLYTYLVYLLTDACSKIASKEQLGDIDSAGRLNNSKTVRKSIASKSIASRSTRGEWM